MVLSWVTETMLNIQAKINVGNMSIFCFKILFGFISLSFLQFFGTVIKKKTKQRNPQKPSSEDRRKGGAENN